MLSGLPAGVGLGLRWEFLEEVLDHVGAAGPPLPVAFFEVSPENYMRRGGYYPRALELIRERYALSSHGLTLSLGSVSEPDPVFLAALRRELDRLGAPFHSDHLSFSFAGGSMVHELLPIAFTQDNAVRIADRLRRLEDTLRRPMAIENVTYYLHPGKKEMPEGEFLRLVLEKSDARLLLDVNNVHVNARNHGFDPMDVLSALPLERVVEIHVAGHSTLNDVVIDTHGAPVAPEVESLLAWTLSRTGPLPVLLERDKHVPPLEELIDEVERLTRLYDAATRRASLRATRSPPLAASG